MTPEAREKAFRAYVERMIPVMRGQAPIESLSVRECGSCNLCCTAPAIDESQIEDNERAWFGPKPAGDACVNCTKEGCSIYKSRPSICKGYLCLYNVGVLDTFPMDGKVCWTFQPEASSETMIAVGHCHDIDEVMRDVDNREDMRAFLRLAGVAEVSAVVLRSPTRVARFDNTGKYPDLMAEIDQTDPMKMHVAEHTQARARWSLR